MCYDILHKFVRNTSYSKPNGCQTWSLTLREKRRLRVYENRALRRIFGSKRGEVTREWRKLHNEELNDLYPSPNIFLGDQIENNEMRKAYSTMGKKRAACRVLMGKPEGRDLLEDPGIHGRIILRWIFWKWEEAWTRFIWLRTGTGGGHLQKREQIF